MDRDNQKVGVGTQVLAGAVAGLGAAWAMSVFQRSWVNRSGTRRKHRPRTDEEVMEEVVRRINFASSAPPLRKHDLRRAGILLHYGFGIGAGALYGVLAGRSKVARKGFGTAFGTAFFALGDAFAPRELKPRVSDSQLVSDIYEWLTHVIYGASLEAGRRGMTALIRRAA